METQRFCSLVRNILLVGKCQGLYNEKRRGLLVCIYELLLNRFIICVDHKVKRREQTEQYVLNLYFLMSRIINFTRALLYDSYCVIQV